MQMLPKNWWGRKKVGIDSRGFPRLLRFFSDLLGSVVVADSLGKPLAVTQYPTTLHQRELQEGYTISLSQTLQWNSQEGRWSRSPGCNLFQLANAVRKLPPKLRAPGSLLDERMSGIKFQGWQAFSRYLKKKNKSN